MQWIRENLFLSCLIGALVVCFGAAYAVRSGQDNAFETHDMEPRADLAFRIGKLNRSDPVNKAWLQKARDRLEDIRKQRDKIVREAGDWNKRNYPVLQLKATTDGAPETIAAFPYNSAVYQRKDLTSKFTNTYRQELYGALTRLDLTSWPTEAEMTALSDKFEKNIVSRRKAADKRVEYAQERSGEAPPPKEDRKNRRTAADKKPKVELKKPEGVSQEDWDLSRLTDADVRSMARRNATEELMLLKANAGIMFISPKTLAMISDPKLPGALTGPEELTVIFPQEVWKSADAPASKLWMAQLNLWITQDILAAIDTTNQQSLRLAGRVRKATVPNAAIKRLIRIAVGDDYLMKRGGEGDDNALTQRVTTSEYEIVRYEFEMVTETAYLPALTRNLAMRGDHVVTNISIEHLPAGPDGVRYYGTDPVVNARLVGEVLFRSSWTRKIMPIETLKVRLGSLHSPEDAKRLEQEGR